MAQMMKAMLFDGSRAGMVEPLTLTEMPVPQPGAGEVLIKVTACAVCRTDLHVVDGDLTEPKRRSFRATKSSARSRRSDPA